MTTALSISRLVSFGAVVTPQGILAPSLNTGLLLGTSAVIDTVSRMRTYATLAAVGEDFGESDEEYLAAQEWFGQKPAPLSLSIGRWCKVAAAGQLIGGALTTANQQLSAWTGIATGSLKIAADGGAATNVTAIDFAGAASLGGVAGIIQAAIQALGGTFAGVTCVYDANYERFQITSGTAGSTSAVAFLTAEGTGTDITGMMEMLATSSGAYEAPGLAAETCIAAVDLFDNMFGGQWYHFFAPDSVDADNEAIAPYFDGDLTPHFDWINTQEAAVLTSGDTTSIAYHLQQLLSQHAAVQYSSQSLYAVWSLAALFAGVNWGGSNTAISAMYKTEPTVTPEILTGTQTNNLESYDCNVYVEYSTPTAVAQETTAIIEPGICPSGQFIDTIIGVDGLRTQCQTNVFNALLTTSTKIPQTDSGMLTLEAAVDVACAQYVTNGLLAPGVWNSGGFGTLTDGSFLDSGYYIYAPPVGTQTEAQRAARIAPPIQVAAKLAGAVDEAAGTLYVNQ